MLNIILIYLIICYILGISGFANAMKQNVWNWLHPGKKYVHYSLRPFDCEICMNFWTISIYSLIIGYPFWIGIALGCLAAYSAPNMVSLLILIDDLIKVGFSKLYKWLD